MFVQASPVEEGGFLGSEHRGSMTLGPLTQELIRNKARNRQNCALLEQAYAVVSALPQRAENKLHVSLMENYPGTLEALGEPIRQVVPWDVEGGTL